MLGEKLLVAGVSISCSLVPNEDTTFRKLKVLSPISNHDYYPNKDKAAQGKKPWHFEGYGYDVTEIDLTVESVIQFSTLKFPSVITPIYSISLNKWGKPQTVITGFES